MTLNKEIKFYGKLKLKPKQTKKHQKWEKEQNKYLANIKSKNYFNIHN